MRSEFKLSHDFETVSQARQENERRLGVLEKKFPEARSWYGDCRKSDPCFMVRCALCARRFRISTFECISPYYVAAKCEAVTMLLEEQAAGDLKFCDVKAAADQARVMFKRKGFMTFAAGIEAVWKPQEEQWVLHLHGILFDEQEGDVEALKAAYRLRAKRRGSSLERISWSESVRETPELAVSYFLKFVTYMRIGQRAVPMPAARLTEWVSWTSDYQFSDFRVLAGMRPAKYF